MEIIGIVIFLVSPIYWGLYKLHGRLTKVETKVGFLFRKNGGEE